MSLILQFIFIMPRRQQNTDDAIAISISLTREQWAIHGLLLRSGIPTLSQPLWRCGDEIADMFEASLQAASIHTQIQQDITGKETDK